VTVDHVYDERVAPGEPVFDAHFARYQRAAASISAGARVLDAGCGVGYGSALLASGRREVVGVDVSREAIEDARRAHGAAARFVLADVTRLPFDAEAFDAVTCFEVIEHVAHPHELVHELARVLAPGGLLFLSTPHARIERLHATQEGREGNPYHVSSLLPHALRALLRGNFDAVRLYGQSEDRGRLHGLLQAVDPLGLRMRVAAHRRDQLRAAFAPAGSSPQPTYVFSRPRAWSAPITYAEARKR